MYGLIPPWHLHLIMPGVRVNLSHIVISVQLVFPDTQLSGTVHLGLLSLHPVRRKHVSIPRKLKYVKSLHTAAPLPSLYLYNRYDMRCEKSHEIHLLCTQSLAVCGIRNGLVLHLSDEILSGGVTVVVGEGAGQVCGCVAGGSCGC